MKKLLIALMLISLIFCVSCTQTGGETTTQQGIGEETTLQYERDNNIFVRNWK